MLIFIVAIIITVSAIQVYSFEKKNVIILGVSFAFSILGAFGFILIEYGVVDQSFFIIDPVSAGLGIEILLLSIAMATRVKKISADANQLEADNQLLEKQNTAFKENQKISDSDEIKLNDTSILFSAIKFIESDGHELNFNLQNQDQPVQVRMSMKQIITLLPYAKFIQIHRSYIVNIDFVKIKYASKLILKDGKEIPVSRSFKNELQNLSLQS